MAKLFVKCGSAMSRIGKTPITIPEGVTVTIQGGVVVVKGQNGELSIDVPKQLSVKSEENTIVVERKHDDISSRSLHGLYRSLIQNDCIGVSKGWTRELELVGVGYRAKVANKALELTVGFSHPVHIEPPAGIEFAVDKNKIIVKGIKKQLVGQTAAKIRAIKKPEPYKGKGIRYVGEHVRKKAGKAAKAVGGGGPGA